MSLAHAVVHVKPVGGDQAGDVGVEGRKVDGVEPVLERNFIEVKTNLLLLVYKFFGNDSDFLQPTISFAHKVIFLLYFQRKCKSFYICI